MIILFLYGVKKMDIDYFKYQLEENIKSNAFSFSRFIHIDYTTSSIIITVDRGGSTGGNCWDGISESYFGFSGDPTYEVLLKILQPINPNITDSDMNKIIHISKNSTLNDDAYSDYYGNYSVIEKITVDIDKIILYFIGTKFITD